MVFEAGQTIQPKLEEIGDELVTNARKFLEFWEANKESNWKFIVTQTSEDIEYVSGQIDIYESGRPIIDNFDPSSQPCQPSQPECTVLSADSIKVTWDMASGDNITGFAIKYTDSEGIENVKLTDSTLTEHTVIDLTPSESYTIAVCAQTSSGGYGPYVAAKGLITLPSLPKSGM